ncbi:diadenylate cyclase CdaA [Mucisphaera calidilacus]|uniref:Diadenylate cyclase n=1 Tax=Mucisphaera calidilacus TaxID=2527982 RepID=A0A518BYQ4_9BACT|nr:diadenylate cyclase CdaA [Mucisphaera calidilacus]QDU72100.1 DNA integrity scanning protein DisA [Mucisphaera calidilacus]
MDYDLGIINVLRRLIGYFQTEPLQVAFELLVIAFVVTMILRFLRGTRGARVVKGLALVLVVGTVGIQLLAGEDSLSRLRLLYDSFLTLASVMLVVVFAPELRRAFMRLGEASFFTQGGVRRARVVEEIVAAIQYLSRNKIGALVAIERQVGLRGIVEVGTRLDAELSASLLNTIFWPGSALHDLGVVIQGDRVIAAGVQFPLSEREDLPRELGSRHRAAIGLSEEADALILVVSEETGTISVAERGVLRRNLTIDDLRPELNHAFGQLTLSESERSTTTTDTPLAGKG